MLKSCNIHGVYVLDQEQAKDFYVNQLGLEVSNDIDLGFMRWLTVRVPGDTTHEILLESPGAPAHDEKTAETVRELVSKGATGFAAGFTTDDCQKTYDDLKAKGVEVADELTEHFYGTDFGIRDPFGNHIRIVQPKAVWGDPVLDPPQLASY
jgi:predicted enzyme related to lactoylglutathione lyase